MELSKKKSSAHSTKFVRANEATQRLYFRLIIIVYYLYGYNAHLLIHICEDGNSLYCRGYLSPLPSHSLRRRCVRSIECTASEQQATMHQGK